MTINPWLDHVKEFRKSHSNLKYKDVLKEAAKTYTKVGKKSMKGKGIVSDVIKDIKEAKLGSKAVDYISKKVKQEGYGSGHKKKMMMM